MSTRRDEIVKAMTTIMRRVAKMKETEKYKAILVLLDPSPNQKKYKVALAGDASLVIEEITAIAKSVVDWYEDNKDPDDDWETTKAEVAKIYEERRKSL